MTDTAEIRSQIKSLSGEDFVSQIEDICADLQKEQDILFFGFIIYNEETPEYRKVLRDPDYWDALHHSSGDRMLVFALEDNVETEYKVDTSVEMLTEFSPSGSTKSKSYSNVIEELFGKEVRIGYPSVLFFQIVDDEVYDYRLVPLNRGEPRESMKNVQDLLNKISNVLDKVEEENFDNRREIFRLVDEKLRSDKVKTYVLEGAKKLIEIINPLSKLMSID